MSPSASAQGLPTSKTSSAESSKRRRSRMAATRSSNCARVFDRGAAPLLESGQGGLDRALRFRNSRFRRRRRRFVRRARIDRRRRACPVQIFSPLMTSGYFLAKPAARCRAARSASVPGFLGERNSPAVSFRKYRLATLHGKRHLAKIDPVRLQSGSAKLGRVISSFGSRSNCAAETFVGKFRPQKSFVRSVLEQSPDEIRHAGKQLADRRNIPAPDNPSRPGRA